MELEGINLKVTVDNADGPRELTDGLVPLAMMGQILISSKVIKKSENKYIEIAELRTQIIENCRPDYIFQKGDKITIELN